MTIRQFLSVLRTRWRIIAACVLVVIGAAAYTTLTTVPVYQATARVYLSTTKPPSAAIIVMCEPLIDTKWVIPVRLKICQSADSTLA